MQATIPMQETRHVTGNANASKPFPSWKVSDATCIRATFPFLHLTVYLLSHCLQRPTNLASCPTAQGLSLRCETHPAAVALLARLTRLRSLTVMLLSGRGAAAWTADSVATALNVVVRGINDLQEARIGLGEYWSSIPSQRQLAVAIKEGVESMQQTLRQMGRNPTLVGMY